MQREARGSGSGIFGAPKERQMSDEIETVQRPFAAWLRSRGIPFLNPRSDRESTIEPGAPDFTILSGTAPVLLIECKDKDTKITAVQRDWHERASKVGIKVHVCRSFVSCVETTENWLRGEGIGATGTRTAHEVAGERLGKRGGTIFKRLGNGRWEAVRPACATDAGIPDL